MPPQTGAYPHRVCVAVFGGLPNFSLLYDGRSPTLAPLYDLVSTTCNPELTTRLAMNIDGASNIGEVDQQAWQKLAAQTGYSGRFAADAAHDNAMVTRTLPGSARAAYETRY